MITVQATAPGKTIIFGEHAVVYGRPAIAAPITNVQAQATLQSDKPGVGFRIVAQALSRDYLLADAKTDDPLASMVWHTLRHLDQPAPPDAVLKLTSTIPLGRGLGSGAAISTAIARALAHWFGQPIAPAEISELVYEVEKIYHGTPSGIDNTVIAFEQPVYFVKGQPIRRMRVTQPFHLVVGDTGIIAPTYKVVDDVRTRWQAAPEQYEGYFDEIGSLVDQARVVIEEGVSSLPVLGKLMNENQEILESLGVSSPELTQLIEAARAAGAWGAKLSGAGWGGNMIALVPDQPHLIMAVTEALTAAGATGLIVTEVA
jgi:mevalonate kinase